MQSKIFLDKLSTLLMFSGKKKVILKRVITKLETFNFSLDQTLPGKLNLKKTKQPTALKHICLLTALFHQLKPFLETKNVRKASKHYDVPFFLKSTRSFSLVLRWFVRAIRKQGGLRAFNKEIYNILLQKGQTVKEVTALRQKVSKNIMFSHYRWK
jgi:ribosomal protein S7